jgi:uncharacterized peroxidase-related enzyme
MRTFANSPAVLNAYLDFHQALGTGSLSPQLREQIAVVVAESNECEYCLSAHTAIGKLYGLSDRELLATRQLQTADHRANAALRFARELVQARGMVTDGQLEAVRQAGLDDGEITELIANVALNIFTNYFNHVCQTEVDFPKVRPAANQTAA